MIEYFTLPNGACISFDPDIHKYYVEGKEVPSITQLLDRFYGSNYGKVNPAVLKAAAQYGTDVHGELEFFIKERRKDPTIPITSEHKEVQNYFSYVEPFYKISPIMTEKVVALYDQNNNIVACGRFDLLCYLLNNLTLVDFKTTSTINRDHVTGQLNLYLTAAYQSGYINTTDVNLGVIQLVGDKARFVPITKMSEKFYLQFISGSLLDKD